jgi:hypothetical protein
LMLIYAVLFLAILTIAYILIKKRLPVEEGDEQWPYYAKTVLSQPEQALYHRLVAALPEHIVLAQVQVSRVLGVKMGFDLNAWNNRISRMSYDFLVCQKDFGVIAVIELDDRSHEKAPRIETDRKKNRATAAASIPLIRWHVSALPDETSIRQALAKHIRPSSERRIA